MKTLSTFQGRRIEDPHDGPRNGLCDPGDYYKDKNGEWRGQTPNGLYVWLKNHHVEEHEDGTISVVAGPWGNNSIQVTNGAGIGADNSSWHGCIKRGVWKEF